MASDRECDLINERISQLEKASIENMNRLSRGEQMIVNLQSELQGAWKMMETKADLYKINAIKETIGKIEVDLRRNNKTLSLLCAVLGVITLLMFQDQLPQILNLIKLFI